LKQTRGLLWELLRSELTEGFSDLQTSHFTLRERQEMRTTDGDSMLDKFIGACRSPGG
jgi:hypothetical protein